MDKYKTPIGDVSVTYFGHASLLLVWNDKYIYVDPYSEVCDYTGMHPADLILITHNHYDHYDSKAIEKIQTLNTEFVVSGDVGEVDSRYKVYFNNESTSFYSVIIDAVPSYNVNRVNENGELFHPKGVGNGYVLDFGGCKFYVAGDTEPIYEMKFLPEIDVAFLPKNMPYTMTDEEFINLANEIRPKYLYPIHFFKLDIPSIFRALDTGITLIDTNKKQK